MKLAGHLIISWKEIIYQKVWQARWGYFIAFIWQPPKIHIWLLLFSAESTCQNIGRINCSLFNKIRSHWMNGMCIMSGIHKNILNHYLSASLMPNCSCRCSTISARFCASLGPGFPIQGLIHSRGTTALGWNIPQPLKYTHGHIESITYCMPQQVGSGVDV